ncbi:hypothetical protein [Modestobacter marinus]|uniref:hypothetical protein n=1 Tax=Modestobacter marinus TaxID=477641 RepID=UPI001C952ECA|nr:hypothetical protein [Modestobacter marinus]
MTEDVFPLMDEWGPEKVVCVSDRRSGMRGVLVLDNTARGMGKGGTRMSPTLTVREVTRLARTIRNEVPAEYVFGLDMGLTERDAAVFLYELGDRGAAVGLPRELGGLPYDELGVTGFGVAEAADAAAIGSGWQLAGSRVAIQGFGAVGEAAARRFVELGATVVAISTAVGAVHDPDGLDVSRLSGLRAEAGDGCVREYGNVQPADRALSAPADVLVPAAREDVIDEGVALATTARLVVEGANLPSTGRAREILAERGIPVVPDFIANAGGIVAAAHSMDMRYSPFRVDRDDVFSMVSTKLRANATAVLGEAKRTGQTPHTAAQRLAQERVLAAMRLRGQAPIDVVPELMS